MSDGMDRCQTLERHVDKHQAHSGRMDWRGKTVRVGNRPDTLLKVQEDGSILTVYQCSS